MAGNDSLHYYLALVCSALYSGLVSKNDKRTTTTESAFLVLSKGSNLANKEEDTWLDVLLGECFSSAILCAAVPSYLIDWTSTSKPKTRTNEGTFLFMLVNKLVQSAFIFDDNGELWPCPSE